MSSIFDILCYIFYFLIIHLLVKILYLIFKNKTLYIGLENIPLIGGHWFFGIALELKKNLYRLLEWRFEQLEKDKTKRIQTAFFSPSIVIVTIDPVLVKHILKDQFNRWTKPETEEALIWHLFGKFVGRGIFLAPHGPDSKDKGHLWTVSRKIASLIFTRDNFRELMRNTFVEHGKIFVDVLKKHQEGKPIDMQFKFFAFTMDSVMNLFFGKESKTLQGVPDEFASAFDTAHRSMMTFFRSNLAISAFLDNLPFPFGPLIPGLRNGLASRIFFQYSREGIEFAKAVSTLDRISHQIIDEKINDPNLKSQKSLLALYMNAEDEEGKTYAQPKYKQFLRDTILNFVIAGRDTTACSLTWLFYILSTNPHVQDKLCTEIDNVLKGKDPEHDDLVASNMPYLNGVIYETFRLYPPVAEDAKKSVVEDILPDGTKVPKGTTITFFPYGMGRDPERYSSPEEVIPERWIPFTKPSDYDFPVFQAGPRICLGMQMAILEIKVLTSMLLQNFTFTLLEGENEKIGMSLMITKSLCNSKKKDSHNLWLIPHARDKKMK